jgi:hypothetical protein
MVSDIHTIDSEGLGNNYTIEYEMDSEILGGIEHPET